MLRFKQCMPAQPTCSRSRWHAGVLLSPRSAAPGWEMHRTPALELHLQDKGEFLQMLQTDSFHNGHSKCKLPLRVEGRRQPGQQFAPVVQSAEIDLQPLMMGSSARRKQVRSTTKISCITIVLQRTFQCRRCCVQAGAELPAQRLHHAVDAGDVVVTAADELEGALHRVLPQHPCSCAAVNHHI